MQRPTRRSKATSIPSRSSWPSKGRKLYELTLSDINHAIRSGYSDTTNVKIAAPEQDVKLDKDKVIILGAVSVMVEGE